MSRQADQILLLASNGCGKTETEKLFIIRALQNKEKALVVVSDPCEFLELPEITKEQLPLFKKAAKIVYYDGFLNDFYAVFNDQNPFNGLLDFNDLRAYFKIHIEDGLRRLFIRRRMLRMDIIGSAHGFTEVPPVYFTYTKKYILWYTSDAIERRKDCIASDLWPKLFEARQRINQRAKDVKNIWVPEKNISKVNPEFPNWHYNELIK